MCFYHSVPNSRHSPRCPLISHRQRRRGTIVRLPTDGRRQPRSNRNWPCRRAQVAIPNPISSPRETSNILHRSRRPSLIRGPITLPRRLTRSRSPVIPSPRRCRRITRRQPTHLHRHTNLLPVDRAVRARNIQLRHLPRTRRRPLLPHRLPHPRGEDNPRNGPR